MIWRQSNPYARSNSNNVPADFEGHGNRFEDFIRKFAGNFRAFYSALHDGKFITAETRHGVTFTHAAREPFRHASQQLVAQGVAKRVVDLLEAIEIDTEQRYPAAITHPHQGIVDVQLQQ